MSITALITKSGQIVTFKRPVREANDIGGIIEEWSNIYENLNCWVQPTKADVTEKYGGKGITNLQKIYIAQSLTLKEGDIAVWQDANCVEHIGSVLGVENQAGLIQLNKVIVSENE